MAKFVLQRIYSEAGESNNGSTAKKIAAGTAATAATTALAFAGARRGVFGTKAAQAANKTFMKAGRIIKAAGGAQVGDKMMYSGAEKYGKARAKELNKRLVSKYGKNAALTEQQIKNRASKVGERELNRVLI